MNDVVFIVGFLVFIVVVCTVASDRRQKDDEAAEMPRMPKP